MKPFHSSSAGRLRPLLARAAAFAPWLLASAFVPAQAALIVQDLNFNFGPIAALQGVGTHTEVTAQTGWFQRFDPTLGTLTAARWELQSSWAGFGVATVSSLATDPNAPVTGIFALDIGIDSRINAAGGLLGTAGLYFSHGAHASQGCTTTLALGACQIAPEIGALFDGTLAATDLAALVGTDAFEQGVEAGLMLTHTTHTAPEVTAIDSSGQLIWANHVDRGGIGRLRLVYEFDAPGGPQPVPEPATLALVGAGLAMLWPARRRVSQPLRCARLC